MPITLEAFVQADYMKIKALKIKFPRDFILISSLLIENPKKHFQFSKFQNY